MRRLLSLIKTSLHRTTTRAHYGYWSWTYNKVWCFFTAVKTSPRWQTVAAYLRRLVTPLWRCELGEALNDWIAVVAAAVRGRGWNAVSAPLRRETWWRHVDAWCGVGDWLMPTSAQTLSARFFWCLALMSIPRISQCWSGHRLLLSRECLNHDTTYFPMTARTLESIVMWLKHSRESNKPDHS